MQAPGVSRGIGCNTERCVMRNADTIAYAPGLYANGAAARSRCITRQFFWMLAM